MYADLAEEFDVQEKVIIWIHTACELYRDFSAPKNASSENIEYANSNQDL